MPLLGCELRWGGPFGVASLQQRHAPGLREYVCCLALTPYGRPVQRRAPLLIRSRDVTVREEQESDGVGKPLYAAQWRGDRPSLS